MSAAQHQVYPALHPYRLAGTAQLAGFTAPATRSARILELGCATGWHALVCAAALPEAEYLALETDAEALATAQARLQDSGLENLQLIDMALESLPEAYFDYILLPSTFAWADAQQRAMLCATVRRCLKPQGLAAIRYPVAAGWHLRKALLPVLRHSSDAKAALQQVLAQEAELGSLSAWLEEETFPACPNALEQDEFLHFLQQAELAKLTDVDNSSESPEQQQLQSILKEYSQAPAWGIALVHHADMKQQNGLQAEHLEKVYLASSYQALTDMPPLHFENLPVRFSNSEHRLIIGTEPLQKAALFYLGQVWPSAQLISDIHAAALDLLRSSGLTAEELQGEAYSKAHLIEVLYPHCLRQEIELFPEPPPYARELPAVPQASPLAQMLCKQGQAQLHNLRGEWVELSPMHAAMLSYCNGERDQQALLEIVLNWAKKGLIRADTEEILDEAAMRDSLADLLQQMMDVLLRQALILNSEQE